MDGVNAAAVANAEIGKEQVALAREQMVKADARQAEFDPLYKELINSSISQSKLGAEQSAEQWKIYRDQFAPLESKLAKTAAEFDTPQRRDAEATAAGAEVGIQFDQNRDALNRDIGRSGQTLTGGKALALASGSRLAEAKAVAGAETQARRQVEQAGISLVDNAARFGRNMPSTGLATAQMSLGAGQSAAGQLAGNQSTYNASMAPGQTFYSGATGANSSAGNLLLGAAQVQQQADSANSALLGSVVGAGLGAYALKSTEKSKDVEGDVDPDAALASVVDTPVKAWRYKDGMGDSRLRLGPMAEAVAASTGVGDGKTLDIATELGTLRAAVQALAKDNVRRKVRKAPKADQLMLSALPI